MFSFFDFVFLYIAEVYVCRIARLSFPYRSHSYIASSMEGNSVAITNNLVIAVQ